MDIGSIRFEYIGPRRCWFRTACCKSSHSCPGEKLCCDKGGRKASGNDTYAMLASTCDMEYSSLQDDERLVDVVVNLNVDAVGLVLGNSGHSKQIG